MKATSVVCSRCINQNVSVVKNLAREKHDDLFHKISGIAFVQLLESVAYGYSVASEAASHFIVNAGKWWMIDNRFAQHFAVLLEIFDQVRSVVLHLIDHIFCLTFNS